MVGDKKAFVWFEWLDEFTLSMHFCANPEHRKKWLTKHVYNGLYYALEFLGAKKVYVIANKNKDVIRYVERLGWFKDEVGYYIHV